MLIDQMKNHRVRRMCAWFYPNKLFFLLFVFLFHTFSISESSAEYIWSDRFNDQTGHSCNTQGPWPARDMPFGEYYRTVVCPRELAESPHVVGCRVVSNGGCRVETLGLFQNTHPEKESEKLGAQCDSAGNPITLSNGNKFEEAVDYTENRPFPLTYTRYYNSQVRAWTAWPLLTFASSSTDKLIRRNGEVSVFREGEFTGTLYGGNVIYSSDFDPPLIFSFADGKKEWFNRQTDGSWLVADPASATTLSEEKNASGELIGYRIETVNNTRYQFNAALQLTQVSKQSGYSHSYSFPNANTLRVTHSLGHALNFSLNNHGQVESLTTPDGLVIRYHYNPDRQRLDQVEYVISGNESQFITYHYQDLSIFNQTYKNFLVGMTDEQGVRYATWGYDSKLRANHSEHANGRELTTVDTQHLYDEIDPRVIVANSHGKQTIFHYQTINDRQLITYVEGVESSSCAATNQYKTYYADGSLQTQTDWKRKVTYFERDAQNRVILQREGYAWKDGTPRQGVQSNVLSLLEAPAAPDRLIETRTCWHSQWSEPERVIEANSVTLYSYTSEGRLQSTTVAKRDATNEQCQ